MAVPCNAVPSRPDVQYLGMTRPHPHADATYRVVERRDGEYGVEVCVPDAQPAMVTSFRTESEAERWIVDHKAEVDQGYRRRRFRTG